MENKAKFYTFIQNNSGGHFSVNDRICEYVIIEAIDADDANMRAENIGIYFNGCENGRDCDCCGDRWNFQYNDDGNDVPSIFGTPVTKTYTSWYRSGCIIHYLDGRVEKVTFEEEPKLS
jgi:hypothetical protein